MGLDEKDALWMNEPQGMDVVCMAATDAHIRERAMELALETLLNI